MPPRDRRRGWPRRKQRVAERTRLRRPDHGCTDEEIQRMKTLRDYRRFSFKRVAEQLGKTEEAVKLALAATRSPYPESGKRVVNTDSDGLTLLVGKALPGETRGQTFARVLHEHTAYERLLQR